MLKRRTASATVATILSTNLRTIYWRLEAKGTEQEKGCRTGPTTWLLRLVESLPWNRFLGSLKVLKIPSLGSIRRVTHTFFTVVFVGSNTPLPSKLSQHLPYLFPILLFLLICVARFMNIISTCVARFINLYNRS